MVAVLIPYDLIAAVEVLLIHREKCNIPSDNPYFKLFATKSSHVLVGMLCQRFARLLEFL